jgi:hypothetical protein
MAKSEEPELPDVDVWDDSKPTERIKFKDYWSIVLSTTALIISLGSTYYGVVRKFDHILLKTDIITVIFPSTSESDILVKSSSGHPTFINSGNRPAAISSLSLLILRRPSKINDDCTFEEQKEGDEPPIILSYTGTPFVIKAEQIEVRDVSLEKPLAYDLDTNGNIVIPMGRKRDVHTITTCLFVQLIDSNGELESKTIPLADETISLDGRLMRHIKTLTDTDKPISLLRRVRSIFGE